ncbi:ribosomal-protein-serine acetyltransferase [Pseudoalteromonas rubra]|uniref:Ribosomal-protein-serine acetyltransferase n=1 Tax=Pseudoalteromonas rubra TaxID=43658 RepID=A0A8T0C5I9_9GAMM|nr:GNAT family N-acetyltransferase [Pseudoalteromonas rubra]KAF7785873.1 ribosomal-protein-serine acetyltransferase [Pseudoalteromonas rubra]
MEHRISTHLYITPLDTEHADTLFDAVEASRESLQKYLPWVEKLTEIRDAETYIAERTHLAGTEYFAIMQQNRFIGVFAIKPAKARNTCEIGYWLIDKARGKAVISQIIGGVLPYLKNVRQVRYVEFHCLENNKASIKIAKRAGASLIECYSSKPEFDAAPRLMCLYRAYLQ